MLTKSAMHEVDKIVMDAYKNAKIKRMLFLESWEFSIKGKIGERVIVRLSREKLVEAAKNTNREIPLSDLAGESMGVFLGEITYYDASHNQAKARLISHDHDIDGIIVAGSPLCSYGYFKMLWFLKGLKSKYGKPGEFLQARLA